MSAGVTWLLKGDAGQRALIAWHMGWEPAKVTAGQAWMPRFLAETLVDPYSTVRYISEHSLKRLPGFEDFSYDYIGPAIERAQARQRALEIWRGNPVVREGTAPLPRPDSLLNEDHVSAMLRQRDNRRMELLE